MRPSSEAAQTPRSVIRPVTNLAGVTSNAGLQPRDPSGVTLTSEMIPDLVIPLTNETSRSSRSSIGISFTPFRTAQSIVGDGNAT